jgi:hypothetical protein
MIGVRRATPAMRAAASRISSSVTSVTVCSGELSAGCVVEADLQARLV